MQEPSKQGMQYFIILFMQWVVSSQNIFTHIYTKKKKKSQNTICSLHLWITDIKVKKSQWRINWPENSSCSFFSLNSNSSEALGCNNNNNMTTLLCVTIPGHTEELNSGGFLLICNWNTCCDPKYSNVPFPDYTVDYTIIWGTVWVMLVLFFGFEFDDGLIVIRSMFLPPWECSHKSSYKRSIFGLVVQTQPFVEWNYRGTHPSVVMSAVFIWTIPYTHSKRSELCG